MLANQYLDSRYEDLLGKTGEDKRKGWGGEREWREDLK